MSHNISDNGGNDGAGDQRNGDQRNASSSRDIAARVVNALENDEGMRPYGIKAEAYGQKVRLWGIVDVLAEKQRAEQIALSVPGVEEVVNDLTISTDGRITDSGTAFEAMEELALEPGVDLKRVGARSEGGTVILEGRVEDQEEKDAAMRAASKSRGARNVVSRLKVEKADK
ncbi:MAG TPA: BON domain-containing protein [Firmicutes bacterium]|nr:BON domain-containing protein [Bacillota bacterium]